jgi:hypothetical protein
MKSVNQFLWSVVIALMIEITGSLVAPKIRRMLRTVAKTTRNWLKAAGDKISARLYILRSRAPSSAREVLINVQDCMVGLWFKLLDRLNPLCRKIGELRVRSLKDIGKKILLFKREPLALDIYRRQVIHRAVLISSIASSLAGLLLLLGFSFQSLQEDLFITAKLVITIGTLILLRSVRSALSIVGRVKLSSRRRLTSSR